MCQSTNCSRQYAADAASIPGIVAGNGEATATIGAIPAAPKSGEAIADPPFPNRPPRKPTAPPTSTTVGIVVPCTSACPSELVERREAATTSGPRHNRKVQWKYPLSWIGYPYRFSPG